MGKITISSEELLRFGGIDYCLAKKNYSSLQDCEVTLSEKPGALELMIFEKYLSDNHITLKSLRMGGGKEIYNINGYKVLTELNCCNQNQIEKNKKILERINSEENKELWASMVNTFSAFSIKGPSFWKFNFEKLKPLLSKTAADSEVVSVKKLKVLFGNNYDIGNNLILASKNEVPSDFIENSEKLISNLKEITKDKRAVYSKSRMSDVLLYSTKLFHPNSETLFFIQVENGIEFLAPNLNLYLFFSDFETHLIVPYFEYLKNNFINLTKKYADFVKGNTVIERFKEKENENLNDITYDSRNRMLQKIKQVNPCEHIIQNCSKKITELAASYNLDLSCSKNEDAFKILITKNDDNSQKRSFDFTIQKRTIIENYDNTMQMLEKEFKKISARVC